MQVLITIHLFLILNELIEFIDEFFCEEVMEVTVQSNVMFENNGSWNLQERQV
jgi:hypothetical protein